MLILITSGTKAPVLMNSFFLLNLLFFSDVDLACDGCGVGALGVLLTVDLLFSDLQVISLLFNFRKYSFFLSLWF